MTIPAALQPYLPYVLALAAWYLATGLLNTLVHVLTEPDLEARRPKVFHLIAVAKAWGWDVVPGLVSTVAFLKALKPALPAPGPTVPTQAPPPSAPDTVDPPKP